MAYDRAAMLKLLRPAMTRILTPLGTALVSRGVGPDAVTAFGTTGTVVTALVMFPMGHLWWGAFIIGLFTLLDLLDGVVARLGGGGGSTWGAFLDSTFDRVADAAIFSGVAAYLVLNEQLVLAAVVLFCLVAGMLVSYVKARAEGLGLTCDVGLVERPERLVVGLCAVGFSQFWEPLLALGMVLLALGSAITVVQRVVHVRRQTGELHKQTGER
ncbi:CDP-alcohol phosphatidyltransferase family protein [Nonomuraea soli]